MTAYAEGTRAGRTPRHLWVVGGLSLLWNGFGAYDYVMTHTRGDPYLLSMGITEAQLAYFRDMPAWVTADWAIGVWVGLLGSVFLLLRWRWAVPAFAVSLAAVVMSLIYTSFLSDSAELMAQHTPMQIVVLVIALFLTGYAWAMAKRGVLR